MDRGGITREFFHIVFAQLFDPEYAIFAPVAGGRLWFTAYAAVNGGGCNLLGTIVAIAVFHGIVLPVRFPHALYRKLLGLPMRIEDLAEIDPETAQGLEALIDMRDRGEDVADAGMVSEVTVEMLGHRVEVVLMPDRPGEHVTNHNLDEYVEAYVRYSLHGRVDRAFEQFEAGFRKLLSVEDIRMFAPDQLDIIVSGVEEYDWDSLKQNVVYGMGYTAESQAIQFFWEVFDGFSQKEKVMWLLFTTGTDRPPIGGLGSLNIRIHRTANRTLLPTASTCMFTFVLPDYPTKEELREKLCLTLAWTETAGFGLR
jgi:hypothetical protein